MEKKVKAYLGTDKKIEFEMPIETAKKVLNLQRIIKEQRNKEKDYTIPDSGVSI